MLVIFTFLCACETLTAELEKTTQASGKITEHLEQGATLSDRSEQILEDISNIFHAQEMETEVVGLFPFYIHLNTCISYSKLLEMIQTTHR